MPAGAIAMAENIRFDSYIESLPREDREILLRFAAFRNTFSVDWFSHIGGILPSQIFSLMSGLIRNRWLIPDQKRKGYYSWTEEFPRDSLIERMPPDKRSLYLRDAIDILRRYVPEGDLQPHDVAGLCLRAGIRESDLQVILHAAVKDEENHRIGSAILFYDAILNYLEEKSPDGEMLTGELAGIFIAAVESRASLSLLYPDLKRIKPRLDRALEAAVRENNATAQGSLELLMGQHHWMFFQYDHAAAHFQRGWDVIRGIDEPKLKKRALQMRGLSCWISGELARAVQLYEDSLEELDQIGPDTFSLVTGLHLALCYTQVGMPQRGLGLSETIYSLAKKNENRPLMAFALANTGLILFELRQPNCRAYFEMALDLARKESIPMAEVLAGIGMANLECMEGNYAQAAEHFKSLYRIRKSSWYYTLNSSHVFEPGFILHRTGSSPIELNPVINYLREMKPEQLNPLMHAIIRRLQLAHLESDKAPWEKISELLDLEKSLERIGAVLELSKVRIDIARYYLEQNKWPQAETYGRKAWQFYRLNAREAFPEDLKNLIRSEDLSSEDRLYDIIVEMGDALTMESEVEYLTHLISSISRLTGAERAGLFVQAGDEKTLRMTASRNLTAEQVSDPSFESTMRIIMAASGSTDNKVFQHEKYNEKTGEVRHVIINPLVISRRSIGVLYQDSRFFSFEMNPARVRLISALASQIAVSIDRARAYDEISRLKESAAEDDRYYPGEVGEEFRPLGGIIGTSEAIIRIQQIISRVAPTISTILVLGETGTGKELVARAVHRESNRRDGPFIRVNCAALPDTLIDSELFGYEKGAFTGAIRTKPGRFELAHNGTIFLDEVSELPPGTQSRLLRVLQEKEFQRVGGTRTLRSDFRLIAASNKRLEQEVEDGRFRADLFFRLNVFPIRVPSLRERKEDIPLLASHFLRLFSHQYGRSFQGIPQSEMERLLSYSWPGNVRELANVIERAVVMGGPRIVFSDFPPALAVRPQAEEDLLPLRDTEREQILKALHHSRGKIGGKEGAASLLGLKRTTLIHRMKRLGISVTKQANGK